MKRITLPIDNKTVESLECGEMISLSGIIYTARDAAHQRLINCINNNEELPFDLQGQAIYYVGPTPNKEGEVIGSAGPTTSYRMDDLTEPLLDRGIKLMIGKGKRNQVVIDSMKKNTCAYLAAIGGAGAYISNSIKKSEVIAYNELGAEAIRRLEVENLQVIVAIDCRGNNIYEIGSLACANSNYVTEMKRGLSNMTKDYSKLALEMHEQNNGKITVQSKVKVENKDDLSIAYTPGVAAPCVEISKDEDLVYKYTSKGNMVAVVSDGTAVLGLGDIGASASIPVMEGKAILFKDFADVDAFPICLKTKEVDEIVNTVKLLEPVFGGINLEDISAPRCFEIENKLKEELNIPVFHDDQHGTAIVVAAAIINSLKLIDKKIEELEVVLNGPGAAGIAITKILLSMGVKNVVLCGLNGALEESMEDLNWAQKEMLEVTNIHNEKGLLADVIKNKDVFIGVSGPNCVTKEMVASMADKAIILAMANPTPEIMPDLAKEAGAYIVGTGRSDFPNQVNNVLAFPGIFRGALDVRAKEINEEMKIAAAHAIANSIKEEDLNTENILPKAFDRSVAINVAEAVKEAARRTNVARI